MNKQEFFDLCDDKFIYLDGATGSNLIKAGMKAGDCPEKWILDHPDALINLQKEYVQAGTNIVYAPTFTANRIKLKEYGLEADIERINTELIKLSKIATEGKAYVAGDITMTGISLKPVGTMDFETLLDIYKEQISIIEKAGADLLVVETMMSLQETRCALIAAKEVSNLPVMCTLTFEKDGRTLFGTDAKTAAITLESLGACAVGANCSTGPEEMSKIIKDMASVCNVPIIAKPNAGMPSLDKDGKTVYDMDEKTFGELSLKLVEAGASILGGCCGTAPSYIEELKKNTVDKKVVKHTKIMGKRYITSERKTFSFGLEDPFIVVGERINPTGKKKLQAELLEGKLDIIDTYIEEQEECGASILDVNVGMGGIDENEMMLKVLDEVLMHTSLPLSIDTSDPAVLENALRRYPGRALVNSISAESSVMEAKLQSAAKYGAMIIVLPLCDKGLPDDLNEKIDNINTVLNRAYELGFTKDDIVVDALAQTVGANKKAAIELFETIEYSKKNGLATTCGLSNISFGLPERSFVNASFLSMAISKGLTMAIMNPSQELLMNAAFAADLLMDKEDASIRYIERMNGRSYSISSGAKAETASDNAKSGKDLGILYNDVLKGNSQSIVEHTLNEINEGKDPQVILNEHLIPAINEVGSLFNSGKYFLPQLIASAEAMKLSIDELEKHMVVDENAGKKPVVVMATVKGDIHDIGKNLVCMMLKNHGFDVTDLGKDVDKELIVEKAIELDADIIGLSALMTTTMQEMKNVIEYAKSKNVRAKIMVGGAVITPFYADEIGADGYSKDASEAVEVALKLTCNN